MRRAFTLLLLVTALPVGACGGDGEGGSGDLAPGKVFDQAEVTRCLRGQGYRIERVPTDAGVDFTVRRRDGRNSIDVAVERTSGAAEAREQEWRKLAAEAGVEDAGAYYFHYGNVLLGFERVPSEAFRQEVERCLG
jgi:hypothetical protein